MSPSPCGISWRPGEADSDTGFFRQPSPRMAVAPALELAVAASLASTPGVTMPTASAAPQLQWMSQDDWQTVVTRRELVAEQKAERKAQCHQVTLPKAERKSSWQSSNHAGDCVKRLHTYSTPTSALLLPDFKTTGARRQCGVRSSKKKILSVLKGTRRLRRAGSECDGSRTASKEDGDAMRTLSRSLNEET